MAQKQMELFMGNIGNTNMKLGVIGIGAVGSAISKDLNTSDTKCWV